MPPPVSGCRVIASENESTASSVSPASSVRRPRLMSRVTAGVPACSQACCNWSSTIDAACSFGAAFSASSRRSIAARLSAAGWACAGRAQGQQCRRNRTPGPVRAAISAGNPGRTRAAGHPVQQLHAVHHRQPVAGQLVDAADIPRGDQVRLRRLQVLQLAFLQLRRRSPAAAGCRCRRNRSTDAAPSARPRGSRPSPAAPSARR